VLRALNDLEATAAQVQEIGDAAADPAGRPNAQDTQAIDDAARHDRSVQTTLLGLHNALVSGDPDKIQGWERQLGEKEDQLAISLAPRIRPSQSSLQQADKIVRDFSGRQITAFIAQRSEEIPDPLELLEAAMVQCRGMDNVDFNQFGPDVAAQVAELVAGPVPQARRLAQQIMPMLRSVHGMQDSEFEEQRADLEDKAKRMVKANSTTVLRHWLDWEIGVMLSNPQLSAAISEKDSWSQGEAK
jgi:hypothetical protein